MSNLYIPHLMTIEDIYEETSDIRSFRLVFKDKELRESFEFKTGQFGQLNVHAPHPQHLRVRSAQSVLS